MLVFLLLQSSFLLPESLSELSYPPVHRRHFQVPLVQAVPLLLQMVAVILVPFGFQLEGQRGRLLV